MKTTTNDDIDPNAPIKRSRTLPRTHPGELLREDIVPAMDRTKAQIAADLGVTLGALEDILAERQPVTAEIAVRLGTYFGDGPDVWLSMQTAYDLWRAERETDVRAIPRLKQAV